MSAVVIMTEGRAGPEATKAISGAIEEAARKVQDALMADLADMVEGGSKTAQKLLSLVQKARALKVKSLLASSVEEARQYADAYATTISRIKVTALAEAVVRSDQAAAMVKSFIAAAFNALETVVLGVLSTIAQAAVKGAVEGLTGGDSGGTFPG